MKPFSNLDYIKPYPMKLSADRVRHTLTLALTQYDLRQSAKKGYNPHALAIYFQRLEEICTDIAHGADPHAAIVAGFSDRLVDHCLRALDLPVTTNKEVQSGNVFYHPVKVQN